MKEYWVLVGSFGGGKSELSLNMAVRAAKKGPCMLVDMDVINPYFRTSERHELLEKAGVDLVSPPYALQKIEIMSVSARVYAAFTPGEGTVIFDVGGDHVGAIALGQYKPNFQNIPPENLHVLYVVNPMRPLASDLPSARTMLEKIQAASRQRVTGIVNNGNLAGMTTVEHLAAGYDLVRQLSDETGIPVWGTSGRPDILKEFETYAKDNGLDEAYIGKRYPIEVMMHRSWDKYLSEGL